MIAFILSLTLAFAGGDTVTDEIRQTRTLLLDMSVAMFSNEAPPRESILQLSSTLDRLSMNAEHTSGDENAKTHAETLAFMAFQLKMVAESGTSIDTLRSLFREAFYAFHNLHGAPFLQEALQTKNTKILLFSVSMTCDCTRRRCDANTVDIVRTVKASHRPIDFTVIDCVYSLDLMKEYEIEIFPTVVVLDVNNREIGRLEELEEVYDQLAELLR